MSIRELNRPLFELPDEHLARKFLAAFIKFRKECIGRELEVPGNMPVDQAWTSSHDNTIWSFSRFAYTFLAFDVELDGWITNAAFPTESELRVLNDLPMMRRLLDECKAAARSDYNSSILPLIKRAANLLSRWEACIRERLRLQKSDKRI